MATHSIDVVAATAGNDTPGMTETEINDELDTWVANHSEWMADTDAHTVTKQTANMDGMGTEYFGGRYRFELSDSKDNLLTKFEDKLKAKVDWFRYAYHKCDHDESDRVDCSFDPPVDWTSKNTDAVPSDVPDLS